MSRLIKQRSIVDDHWQLLRLNEGETPESLSLPTQATIYPLAVWQARKSDILASRQPLGVWLDADESPEGILGDLGHFQIIAVNFPKFVDGRGYSTARLLRSRYGWHGELRAIGEVLHDQLYYMKRCGFDSFALKEGKDIDGALAKAFETWSENYQAAVDQKQPLFRRR